MHWPMCAVLATLAHWTGSRTLNFLAAAYQIPLTPDYPMHHPLFFLGLMIPLIPLLSPAAQRNASHLQLLEKNCRVSMLRQTLRSLVGVVTIVIPKEVKPLRFRRSGPAISTRFLLNKFSKKVAKDPASPGSHTHPTEGHPDLFVGPFVTDVHSASPYSIRHGYSTTVQLQIRPKQAAASQFSAI
jgi:hypothetical protein